MVVVVVLELTGVVGEPGKPMQTHGGGGAAEKPTVQDGLMLKQPAAAAVVLSSGNVCADITCQQRRRSA